MVKNSRYIGEAGEHRIISELLLRGYNPKVACIDEGIDMILENRKTIQVKTVARNKGGKSRPNSFAVGITTTRYVKGDRIHPPADLRADLFIIWMIPTNSFFIIPREKIKVSTAISITANCKDGYYRFKDRWDLLDKEAKK